MKPKPTKTKPRTVNRSAVTGEFVTDKAAREKPGGTVRETMRKVNKKGAQSVLEMLTGQYVPYDAVGEVRIIAVADGYAMVRRKGRAPFVLSCTELFAVTAAAEAKLKGEK